jgi:hypothetical protein
VIDTFSLLVSHGLILLALWRLLSRKDLDRESPQSSSPEKGAPDA